MMRGWYGWNHMSGAGWFAMTVSTVLLLALVVGGIVLLIRVGQQPAQRSTPPQHVAPPPRRAPDELLADRLARGEIDEDEYRRRLTALVDSGQAAPPP
jgi:putative membrane protein